MKKAASGTKSPAITTQNCISMSILAAAGIRDEKKSPLFRSIDNRRQYDSESHDTDGRAAHGEAPCA